MLSVGYNKFKKKAKRRLERILFILDEYSGITPWLINGERPQGSPALYVLLERIMQENIMIDILYPSIKKPVKNIHRNLHIHTTYKPKTKIKIIVLFERVLQFLQTLVLMFSICFRNKPQVIYSTGYMTLPACFLGRIFNIKIIARVYGTFLYEKFLNKNLINLLSAIPEMLVLKSPADIFIITNDGTRGDKVAEQLKVPQKKIKFWINGVNKKMLQSYREKRQEIRNQLNISTDKIIISSIGRLAKWKRVDLTIKIYAEVLRKNPKIPTELLIVGDGKELNTLKTLARSLDLENNVSFIGAVDHCTALKYMVASDILMFFYKYSNVGNVLLEALSLGKVVVCCDTGDTASFIKHGLNGLLIPNSSDEQIIAIGSEYLFDLLHNPHEMEKLRRNALAFAEKEIPDWEERIKKEITLIKTLSRS
jgi:glycosyltransferase involved in cell wall biosynthesis